MSFVYDIKEKGLNMIDIVKKLFSEYGVSALSNTFALLKKHAPGTTEGIRKSSAWVGAQYSKYGYQINATGETQPKRIESQIDDLCTTFNWAADTKQNLKNYYMIDQNPELPPLAVRQSFFQETIDLINRENRTRRDFTAMALGQGLATQPLSLIAPFVALYVQIPIVTANLYEARKAWVHRNHALDDLKDGILLKPEDPGAAPKKPIVARLPLLLNYLFLATWRHKKEMAEHGKKRARFQSGTVEFHDWQVGRHERVARRENEYAIVKGLNAGTSLLSAGAPFQFSDISYVPPAFDYILDSGAHILSWPFNLATTYVAGKGAIDSISARGAAENRAKEMQRLSAEDFKKLWLANNTPL